MQLVNLPNEILLKIISDTTILSTTDHLSLSYLVLPHLFSSINIIDNPSKSNISHRLAQLNTILTSHPQRKSWLNSLKISWNGENVPDGLPWMTQAKIYGILTQLPALRSLRIGEKILKSFSTTSNSDTNTILGPSKLLLDHSNSFHSLRKLELDDFLLTTSEIATFFTWPNLLHFTILNFIPLYSEETLSPLPKSLVAPHSNIQILEFRRCQQNPFGPLMENLLRKQSQLRKLVIETMGYWRSPLAIYIAIRGLRDTLVELKLTIVLIEGSERRGIGMGAGAGYGGDGTVLDLSEFTVLRKLEVCDHLLFAGPQDESMHMPKWSSYHTLDKGLARRLPASLEFLTIYFQHDHFAFKPHRYAEDDYDWLLSLARYRRANYFRNSLEVDVYEAMSLFDSSMSEKDVVAVPWILPREVETVLKEGGMSVRGSLRSCG